MSQSRARSASATRVNRAARAPSSGYEDRNQLSARSHGCRAAAGSVNEIRAPPATSTAAVAAADSPVANCAGQSGTDRIDPGPDRIDPDPGADGTRSGPSPPVPQLANA